MRLDFDCALSYLGTDRDARPLPRLPVYIALDGDDAPAVTARPILDSGAERSVFDGTVALDLGWSEDDVVTRAQDVRPISGVSTRAPAVPGYLHPVTCLISLGQRFAVLRLQVFFVPPNLLATPVLGRRDFFQQVDFALVEAEQRFYLRFRDRSALRD